MTSADKFNLSIKEMILLVGIGVSAGYGQMGISQNKEQIQEQKQIDQKHSEAVFELQKTDILLIEGKKLDRLTTEQLSEHHKRLMAEVKEINDEVRKLQASRGE